MGFISAVAAVVLLAVLGQAAVVTENGLPIQWDKAPNELSQLPTVDGVIQVNPWDYLQRMALSKLLINSTDPYMSSMGPGEKESPLWSLPLQLGWKLRSGMTDPSPGSSSTCGLESSEPVCTSPQSWYACMNYYMSVLPLLAAVQTAVVGKGEIQLHIQAPAEVAQDYCSSFRLITAPASDCSTKYPDAMTKWETFFQSLQQISNSDDTDFNKDKILGLLWAAEEASLQTASLACSERQKLYSSPEVRFGQGWLNSAAYVAVAHFHTNIEKYMAPLPSRVLQESDRPPNIPDLSAEENHALHIFGWMNRVNQLLGVSLVTLWRRAMCSPQAREKGQGLLHDLILDPKFPGTSLMAILTEMTTSC
ncbi:liver-enriched gene 1, tandem duplicate 1 [Sinocyclocheilus rhinocerous]|uniref:liver-enriched gene 1, tandem duplicate 1 n=1 Tax=Sinocyclocheilus rhinocerous TaxID=307959 RepID=UPI0007B7E25D|nr:PREDICTED: protein leg1a-like [Sinocyclocheilus rhinocerous]